MCNPTPALLRPKEAAALLGVHVNTLKRWETEGKVACLRTPTNRRRYFRIEIMAIRGNR